MTSYLLFEPEYTRELIKLGASDTLARRADVLKIVYAHKSPEGIQLVAHKPVRHTTVCVRVVR